MDKIKQEFHELHKEVTTPQSKLEKLNLLVVSLVAAQNQSHFQQRPQQQYPGYQHFAVVMPATNAVQNPGYQPQFQQYQRQYQQ